MFEASSTSGLTIRPFRPDDLPAILTPTARTGWDHLTPAEQALTTPQEVARRTRQMVLEALSTPGAACFVAEDGGRVVAYELVVIRPDEVSGIPEGLKLDGWVHPDYRGRGLNRWMHQAVEDWCRRMGVRRMVCVVAGHNRASLSATGKAGFETVRVIRAKWI